MTNSPVLWLCRSCGDPATRFLDGQRRSFYCDIHGPTQSSAWPRLRYLEVRPVTATVASVFGPAMQQEAAPVEPDAALLAAFRTLLGGRPAPAAATGESEAARALRSAQLTELEGRVVDLLAQLAAMTADRDSWKALAEQAVDEVPVAPGTPPAPAEEVTAVLEPPTLMAPPKGPPPARIGHARAKQGTPRPSAPAARPATITPSPVGGDLPLAEVLARSPKRADAMVVSTPRAERAWRNTPIGGKKALLESLLEWLAKRPNRQLAHVSGNMNSARSYPDRTIYGLRGGRYCLLLRKVAGGYELYDVDLMANVDR